MLSILKGLRVQILVQFFAWSYRNMYRNLLTIITFLRFTYYLLLKSTQKAALQSALKTLVYIWFVKPKKGDKQGPILTINFIYNLST